MVQFYKKELLKLTNFKRFLYIVRKRGVSYTNMTLLYYEEVMNA